MLTLPKRGLLLIYGAQVFADTSGNIDEVSSPRFFFLSILGFWTANKNILTIKTIEKMKKLFVICCVIVTTVLLSGCFSKKTVGSNRVYDDNSLKMQKQASATNSYTIIVGKERVKYSYGTTNTDVDYKTRKKQKKRLSKLSRKEAEEIVLQEAVIELNCALIVEPNYRYEMSGKKITGITVVGYPGNYNFDKDNGSNGN